jgi:hypothetical protein
VTADSRVTVGVQFILRRRFLFVAYGGCGVHPDSCPMVAGTLSPFMKTDETCGNEVHGLSCLVF